MELDVVDVVLVGITVRIEKCKRESPVSSWLLLLQRVEGAVSGCGSLSRCAMHQRPPYSSYSSGRLNAAGLRTSSLFGMM